MISEIKNPTKCIIHMEWKLHIWAIWGPYGVEIAWNRLQVVWSTGQVRAENGTHLDPSCDAQIELILLQPNIQLRQE